MTYPARAFAELAGVTLKALRHYERRGLLAPRRNAAGHRRYSPDDLRRLDQILALKSLGLPLADVERIADAREVNVLAAHRERLVGARARIDRAIAAIDGAARDPDATRAVRRLMADASWERWEARRRSASEGVARPPDRASPSRLAMFHEVAAAIDGEMSPETARALAARWDALLVSECDGDPETLNQMKEAWANRHAWPDGMRRYIAGLYDTDPATWERVAEFLGNRGGS